MPSGGETPDRAGHYYPVYVDVAADPKLSGDAKVLYGALCYHGRNVERLCYPSQETLASECGVSVQIVTRRLAELRDAGYISWTRTSRTNSYKLLGPQNWGSDLLPVIDTIPQNRRSHLLPVIGKERIKKEVNTEVKTEEAESISDSVKDGIQTTTQTQTSRGNSFDSARGSLDSRTSDDPAWKKLTEDYPGTQDTEASYRQWMSEPDKPTAEEIADVLKAWGEAEQWRTERGRYIPKMSNWIRNRGWLDKPARREEESLPYLNYAETQEMLKRSGPTNVYAPPEELSEEEIEEFKKTAERVGIKWDGPH